MGALAAGETLDFKRYATDEMLHVDGGRPTLITAGLNCVTVIAGFVVFDAVRKALAFDRRLVPSGFRSGLTLDLVEAAGSRVWRARCAASVRWPGTAA
ncbi:hypothetical protein WJ438_34965 [Streptomyces sp. GD-15H]|uniref:hypothetical protein n=1 Tax=Streptomyces sp. GD-15H TaxID=3129112 RepID=UPI003252C53A